ncbi:MAG: aspartate-semialdehyde dehydrogenase [Planctomycetota bacterium]
MSQRPRVALAGATGAVGRELLRLFETRDFPLRSLRLLASPASRGRRVRFRGEDLAVEALDAASFQDVDLAFFSCGAARARRFAPEAAEAGSIVVDNSSAFRLDAGVPLIVPEINAAALRNAGGELESPIIANPNCSTILLVLALAPIARAYGLRRVVVSTYQAASGAGERAMRALLADTGRALSGSKDEEESPAYFRHCLAFNLVPWIGGPDEEGGASLEESKMLHETRKILGLSELELDATCVRVPVLRSHSESVSVETERPVGVAEAQALFREAAGVELLDDPRAASYPTPLLATGRDQVMIGRVRASRVFPSGLSFWLSGDQLRKGAALNALQIAESLSGPG